MTLATTTLTVNGVDVTGPSQWDAMWEERIDGVGQATVTIQDRDPSSTTLYGFGNNTTITEDGHTVNSTGWRDLLNLSIPGLNLYWGEVTNSDLALPPGKRFRQWALSVSDFNTVMDLRLVGSPDGGGGGGTGVWQTIDGGLTHTQVDPNAVGLSTDGGTVTALFGVYAAPPPFPVTSLPASFDASTFVHNWIPTSSLIDPITGQSRLLWTNNTLRGAIDELRGLAGFPVFCWIDPDLAVHYEAFADWSSLFGPGLLLLFPYVPFPRYAPAVITDVHGAIDGSTVIGGRNLDFKLDATYMPQQVYISGVTDYIHNADGTTTMQGTGWPVRLSGRHNALPNNRQVLIDAQAVTAAQRQAVSGSAERYAQRARLRGSVTVGRQDEAVDGWRVGQLLTIIDARLPPALNGMAFPIQRVQGKAVAGQQWREYVLEFGDFPIARFSQKYRAAPAKLASPRLPAKQLLIEWPTRSLRPSTSYTLVGQMVDRSKKPVRHPGIAVAWSLTVLDASGASVGGGSIAQITAYTDANGRNAAVLTTSATTGLHYHVKALINQQL